MRPSALTLVMLALLAGPATAGAEPPSVRVRQDAVVGSREGTLVFGDKAIEFQTSGTRALRQWPYDRLTRVVIADAKTLRLRTDKRRWFWLRRGESSFTAVAGEIPPELIDFLVRRVPVPVVSTVVPAVDSWQVRLPATHERRRHPQDGELRVAQDGSLAFVGGTTGATHFWRRRDVAAVLPLDGNRLQIDINETRGGRPKPYVFRLREPLAADVYTFLWRQISRSNRGGRS